MYNVQSTTQSNKLRQARIGLAVLGIAAVFIACFMATQALLTAVYGFSLETSGSAHTGLGLSIPTYGDVIDKTQQAADKAQGYMIDSYVQNIKAEICPTLSNNISAEAECLDI